MSKISVQPHRPTNWDGKKLWVYLTIVGYGEVYKHYVANNTDDILTKNIIEEYLIKVQNKLSKIEEAVNGKKEPLTLDYSIE